MGAVSLNCHLIGGTLFIDRSENIPFTELNIGECTLRNLSRSMGRRRSVEKQNSRKGSLTMDKHTISICHNKQPQELFFHLGSRTRMSQWYSGLEKAVKLPPVHTSGIVIGFNDRDVERQVQPCGICSLLDPKTKCSLSRGTTRCLSVHRAGILQSHNCIEGYLHRGSVTDGRWYMVAGGTIFYYPDARLTNPKLFAHFGNNQGWDVQPVQRGSQSGFQLLRNGEPFAHELFPLVEKEAERWLHRISFHLKSRIQESATAANMVQFTELLLNNGTSGLAPALNNKGAVKLVFGGTMRMENGRGDYTKSYFVLVNGTLFYFDGAEAATATMKCIPEFVMDVVDCSITPLKQERRPTFEIEDPRGDVRRFSCSSDSDFELWQYAFLVASRPDETVIDVSVMHTMTPVIISHALQGNFTAVMGDSPYAA